MTGKKRNNCQEVKKAPVNPELAREMEEKR